MPGGGMARKAERPRQDLKVWRDGQAMAKSFHDYEGNLQRRIAAIKAGGLSKANRQAMLGFVDDCFSHRLSVARTEKYLGHLVQLLPMFQKDFVNATKDDIKGVSSLIERRDCSEWTKHDMRMTLKKFFRFLRDTFLLGCVQTWS